ncbi:hypothetical protein [Methylobacterium sp. Leaf113]|uniref:hypothetical protein n=1 Tax=Methylobacterium sp. Leaf113 TaxID=1736259 RepID=UPI000A99CC75|nr:hypothetical protein [Methylobacterium sp. Leaf113]
MDRKLNLVDATSSASSDASSEGKLLPSNRKRLLQEQIAEKLGISPDAFSTVPRSVSGGLGAGMPVEGYDVALSRECLELLDAYCRIADPEQRRRCLQIVRDAGVSSTGRLAP